MIQGLGEAMMLTWAQLGVKIEKINETFDNLTLFISVPKSSHHKHSSGEEMAGMLLAKRFKVTLTGMGVKRLEVRVKIRDEFWTTAMAQDAVIEMRKLLYGSQW
jgi:hypothetical protein